MTEKYTPSKGDYIDLKGKKYLPARRRVQWFRGEHPDWGIATSIVDLDFSAGYAVIRAEVTDETGRLIASGMKSETKAGFSDFVEKAETGAIARAVAIAGFGTEDALDLDEGERIADGPVAPRMSQPERDAAQRRGGATPSYPAGSPPAPVQYRRGELASLMKEHHLSIDGVEVIADRLGITERPMSDASMDRLIEAIETPPSEDSPARAGSDAATVPGSEDGGSPPATSSGSGPAPTDEQIEAATGGEIIWPKPGTPEYKALPSGADRAKARAHWEKQKAAEPEQESLAEALGAPTA